MLLGEARRALEVEVGYDVCGILGCVLSSRHAGACAFPFLSHNQRRRRPPPAPLPAAPPPVDEEVCSACGGAEWVPGNELLLCDGDGCSRGAHLRCLSPPLSSVPPGEWRCDRCAPPPAAPRRRRRRGKRPAPRLDEEVCAACGGAEWEEGNELLLCDGEGCGGGYHLRCLSPPLAKVPRGEWRCPRCAGAAPAERRAAASPGFRQTRHSCAADGLYRLGDGMRGGSFQHEEPLDPDDTGAGLLTWLRRPIPPRPSSPPAAARRKHSSPLSKRSCVRGEGGGEASERAHDEGGGEAQELEEAMGGEAEEEGGEAAEETVGRASEGDSSMPAEESLEMATEETLEKESEESVRSGDEDSPSRREETMGTADQETLARGSEEPLEREREETPERDGSLVEARGAREGEERAPPAAPPAEAPPRWRRDSLAAAAARIQARMEAAVRGEAGLAPPAGGQARPWAEAWALREQRQEQRGHQPWRQYSPHEEGRQQW
ncbi:hypothetical protein AB1Y20_012333 [Prymnesium parvum]|uniref:PHD-type domain-containing protein n=1 Tax=Prymnesium parvum TaxID=97485 RepID=A0AB34IQB8_PRYPA